MQNFLIIQYFICKVGAGDSTGRRDAEHVEVPEEARRDLVAAPARRRARTEQRHLC